MHTYSALITDVRKDPDILERMRNECIATNGAISTYVLTLGSTLTVVPVLP